MPITSKRRTLWWTQRFRRFMKSSQRSLHAYARFDALPFVFLQSSFLHSVPSFMDMKKAKDRTGRWSSRVPPALRKKISENPLQNMASVKRESAVSQFHGKTMVDRTSDIYWPEKDAKLLYRKKKGNSRANCLIKVENPFHLYLLSMHRIRTPCQVVQMGLW